MSRLIRCCKRSFRDLGKLTERFETVTPEEVVRSCWQSSNSNVSVGYLLYRWIQFILHVVFELLSLFDVGRRYKPQFAFAHQNVKKTAKYYMKWLLYLTHWGLVLNSVQAFIGVWMVQRAHVIQNRRNSPADTTNALATQETMTKVYCYLWSTAFHLSTYITVGFWLLVFDPEWCGVDAVTLSEHGFGLSLLFLDMLVSGIPYKMFSGICTIILSSFYLLITYVHHLLQALDRFQDKPFIYEKGDWSHPGAVLIYYLFSVFIMISFHFSLWGFYVLRRRVTMFMRARQDDSHNSLPSGVSSQSR